MLACWAERCSSGEGNHKLEYTCLCSAMVSGAVLRWLSEPCSASPRGAETVVASRMYAPRSGAPGPRRVERCSSCRGPKLRSSLYVLKITRRAHDRESSPPEFFRVHEQSNTSKVT